MTRFAIGVNVAAQRVHGRWGGSIVAMNYNEPVTENDSPEYSSRRRCCCSNSSTRRARHAPIKGTLGLLSLLWKEEFEPLGK